MSLLIKALQKAEKAKAGDAKAAPPVSMMPDDALTLEPLYADAGLSSQRKSSEFESKNVKQQVAGVFAAKSIANQTSKIGLAVAAVSIGLSLLIGVKFYSYLQSLNQSEVVIAKVAEPITPLSDAVIASPSEVSESSIPANENSQDLSHQDFSPQDSHVDAIATNDKPDLSQTEKPRLAAQKTPSQTLIFGAPVEKSTDTEIKITRNAPANIVNPTLLTAYQAFMNGDDVTAQYHYRQVLQSDIHNVDALLGMAAIAARQGRHEDAASWYGKVLETEPRNTLALAALAANTSQIDPVATESRIKHLIAQQPDAAYL